MTERKSPHNQTTVPVLDQQLPLAPARPSRVRLARIRPSH